MSLLKNLLISQSFGFPSDAFRRSHTINGSAAGAQTDYQVETELDLFSALPTNAAGHQTTPTSDGSGQVVHPSIVYFPDGWNGYNYWLAMTPYPATDSQYESPEILACNDGVNWVVPAGLTNPIVDSSSPAALPNNGDPCLFYNEATDELWCYYQRRSPGNYSRLYLKKSSDGIDWGLSSDLGTLLLDSAEVITFTSPTVVKIGLTYHLWYIDTLAAPNVYYHRTSTDGETWAGEETCTINGSMPAGKEGWHLEIRYMSEYSDYWMLLTICNTGTPGNQSWMMFARSINGTDWYLYPEVLLEPSAAAWDKNSIYKATFLLDGSTLQIWYSAFSGPIPNEWFMGYTTATFESTIGLRSMFPKMRADGGDLRFTEDDGVTELDYWIEEFDYGGYAVIWVEVANIPAGPATSTIYIYYGRADATTTSDIKYASWNDLGDDFNDNVRDPTLWDISNYLGAGTTVAENNQRLEVTVTAFPSGGGYVSVGAHTMNNVELRILGHDTALSSVTLYLCLTKVTATNPGAEADLYRIFLFLTGNLFYAQKKVLGVGPTDIYSGAQLSSEEEFKIRIEDGTIRFLEQDTDRANEAWALASRDCYIYLIVYGGIANGMDWIDTFWIRKYVNPEPTHGIWGPEEGVAWPF